LKRRQKGGWLSDSTPAALAIHSTPVLQSLPLCKFPNTFRGTGRVQSVCGVAHGVDDQRLESQQGQVIFFFSNASRPALGPIDPPIQWVLVLISGGLKRPLHEFHHSRPSRTQVTNEWNYTSAPRKSLHRVDNGHSILSI
jgi:hypothetical protein